MAETGSPRPATRLARRWRLVAAAALALLVGAVVLLFTLDDGDGFSLIEPDRSLSYLMVFLLIAGDAVIRCFRARRRSTRPRRWPHRTRSSSSG